MEDRSRQNKLQNFYSEMKSMIFKIMVELLKDKRMGIV
jgi:hypothetical protein